MQMSRLMVWSTAFSDDERSETEYRLSADETSLTLSGLPPEKRDNSRDNIRTKHFINAKIHIFTQRSKRNQHRNRSGTCHSGTDKPPGKATINASIRCKIVAGQAAHKLADAQPADIRKSGHGQQSVAPHQRCRYNILTEPGEPSCKASDYIIRIMLSTLRQRVANVLPPNSRSRRRQAPSLPCL